jgi:hypothetical protein
MCAHACVDENKALCKLKKPCRPPDEIPAGGRFRRRVLLPDDFHCELNVTRLGSQVINAPGTGCRSVRIKDRTAVCRLGWGEVRVVQDVENFRAKLNVEGFRDAVDLSTRHPNRTTGEEPVDETHLVNDEKAERKAN